MLKPLQNIFGGNLFENLAYDKFGWVGAQKAKCILLNDFRWSNKLIISKDLLLLLEGEPVKLPAPIFATSKSIIEFRSPYNTTDDMEDEIMKVRWRVFHFSHVFPEDDQKKLLACTKCFCTFILIITIGFLNIFQKSRCVLPRATNVLLLNL